MPNLVTVVGENTHILPHMLKHYENIIDKAYVCVYQQGNDDGILQEIEENVNTCCAITMEPDDVLVLIDKLKEFIKND